MKRAAILALLAVSLQALQAEPRRLLRWSKAVLIAASTADAATSWGKQEANPLLRSANGTYGARGVSIKLAFVGGSFVAQKLVQKRCHDCAAPLAVTNFAAAAFVGSVAARNSRIPR